MVPLHVLYINMDDAPARRRHIEAQVAQLPRIVGAAAVETLRIPGARGDVPDAPLTPWARLVLAQPARATVHAQLETPGAVGCYLSHVRCWDWLLDPARAPNAVALILEDDACLAANFPDVWRTVLAPLLLPPVPAWDCVLLDHHCTSGTAAARVHDRTLWTFVRHPQANFFGTTAYLLTREGARRLRAAALPMEVQVDHYLLLCQQLGWLRLFLLPEPCFSPCLGGVEVRIDHGRGPLHTSLRTLSQSVGPGAPTRFVWGLGLRLLLVAVALSLLLLLCMRSQPSCRAV